MNLATGDDLSINSSYAAEAVSLLFELYQREIVFPNSCGVWYREAVRAEQLAYKLIVCSENLQALGQVADFLALSLTPEARALISCLYIETTSLYPALRSAAEDAHASDQLCYWRWLKSIEHQDWLRSHLACLEGLARVLYLALLYRIPLQEWDNKPFMDSARERSLLDTQLSSAIKRFCLACETCHLNLRTLEGSQKEPWKNAPWKLIKAAHINLDVDAVSLPICAWVTELGRKCDRKDVDPLGRDWDTNRHVLAELLLLDGTFDNDTETSMVRPGRRRSSVRWRDDEGDRLERGSSLLAFKQSTGSPRSSGPTSCQKPVYGVPMDDKLSPRKSAFIEEQQPKPRSNSLVPLSCTHNDCNQHAMQPPLFADQSSLSKHMKLIHKQMLPYSLRQGKGMKFPNDDLPDLREIPPTRSTTPAIDIPQRRSRQYSYIPPSPQVLSPMISPTDKNAFSPSGSALSQLAELSVLLETDIKPAVYTFLHRPPTISPILRIDSRDSRDSRSDSQRPGLNEYYCILDRLINDVIKPANKILAGGGPTSIASREQKRLVREADKWVAMLDRWAGEGSGRRRRSGEGENRQEMERENRQEMERDDQRELGWEMEIERKRDRERGRRNGESSQGSRDRFYSMSPGGHDATSFFGKSN